MENLSIYPGIAIVLLTCISVIIFFKASNNSRPALLIILAWLAIQAIVSLQGFYTVTDTIPPRFSLTIGLPLILIICLFLTKKGRRFLDSLDLKALTLLHVIRIPVEIVLFSLFLNKVIPGIMTFEGRNFDIISGLSAPVIFYLAFAVKQPRRKILLFWNFLCLGLLINIVAIAILAAPFPFQKFAFDQPNIAVLYFPFVLLPCCIVPLVLLSHLASIRQLLVANGKARVKNDLTETGSEKSYEMQ